MPSPHEIEIAARLRMARGEHTAARVMGWTVQRTIALTRRPVAALAAAATASLDAAVSLYFDGDCTLADVARRTGQPPEAVAAELERRGFFDFMTAKNFSRQSVARLGITAAATKHRMRYRTRKPEWSNGKRPWAESEIALLFELAPTMPKQHIAERVGRSVKSVRRKCEELALTRKSSSCS